MMKEKLIKAIAGLTAVILLTGLLLLGCADFDSAKKSSGQDAREAFQSGADGVYEGEAAGCRGIIRVRVRVEEGAIAEIRIIESSEDNAVGGAAMEELIDLMLLYNTTALDAISGATESSEGILAAVENALNTE